MGADYIKEAYQLIYKRPEWRRVADEYEARFAANLYNTDYVQEAARTALSRLSNMLVTYYGLKDAQKQSQQEILDLEALTEVAGVISGDREKSQKVLEETLLSQESRERRAAGAGQIGNFRIDSEAAGKTSEEDMARASHFNQKMINDVMNKNGNLREQMTMLYNGMFINGGKSSADIAAGRSLKNMLVNITPEEFEQMKKINEINEEGDLEGTELPFDLLKEQGGYGEKKDLFDTYTLARDLKRGNDKRKGKGNAFTRWFSGVKRAFNAAFSSTFSRKSRAKEDRRGLGLTYYEDLGLDLSKREKRTGLDDSGRLQWLEGQAYYEMKKPVTAEGLLQTAGPSGTTLRMLGAYKMMGASKRDLLFFRLALMAWMVTSKDHSIYEVLKGSHNAGVKGREDLSEAAVMYKTIDPLTEEQLRNELAPDRRFPHETVYLTMLNEMRGKRRGDQGGHMAPEEGSLFDLGARGDYDALSHDASELALNIYTTDAYRIMNASMKYGGFVGKYLLKNKGIKHVADKEELKQAGLADEMYDLLRISARMAQDGLEERGAKESGLQEAEEYDQDKRSSEYHEAYSDGSTAYRGITFRGGKLDSALRGNGTFTTKYLYSTSQNYIRAYGFYRDSESKPQDKAFVKVVLDGKGAVNITNMSSYSEEREVLVPVGTVFQVTKPLQTAYFSNGTGMKTESELTDTQREAIQRDMEKPDEKSRIWHKCQYVEITEIKGPGEDKRMALAESVRKNKEARERLLAMRQRRMPMATW